MATISKSLWWLLVFSLAALLVQAQEGPKIAKTEFDLPISSFEYFEDSDTVLMLTSQPRSLRERTLWRSDDAGQTWEELTEIKEATYVIPHPFDDKVAFVLSQGPSYWVTHDRGKKWKEHKLPDGLEPLPPGFGSEVLSFHAGDKKRVIFNAMRKTGSRYEEQAFYSKDGFNKPNHLKELRKDTKGCSWARSETEFVELEDKHADDRILCLVKGKFSDLFASQRLVISDNFFKDETEPSMASGRPMSGIVNLAHIKGYLVAAARAEKSQELAMFVSINGLTWHRAEFDMDPKLERSYTVLESTSYSLQVAVATSPMSSVLMSSNSNGTYFTENVASIHRDPLYSYVDFEKVMGFQGVILVNTQDKSRHQQTKISFQDGKSDSWKGLRAGDKEFHLHSVTDKRNPGRVYSSAAPGVLLGVGNTGETLGEYREGDLYVSNDAGHTWEVSAKGPHKYAFGDRGNVLLAVPDEPGKTTNTAKYSLNHGKDWSEFKLDEKNDVHVEAIVITPDTASRTFMIFGVIETEEGNRQVVYSINTDKLLPDTCDDGDFEDFTALDEYCIMGHKQIYSRRKRDSKCFVRAKFEPPKPRTERCQCTAADYECAYNFIPKDGKCQPATLRAPEEQCRNDDDTFESESGFQLIPNNDCDPKGGPDLDKPVQRKCSETTPDPHTGEIAVEMTPFPGQNKWLEIIYLERTKTSSGDDESVMVLTAGRDIQLYRSDDHGKTWERVLKNEVILSVIPHYYDNDAVFILTDSNKIFYSYNRGRSFDYFTVKDPFNPHLPYQPFSFHQDKSDTFIWTGASSANCRLGEKNCHLIASYTDDRGDSWKTLKRYTEHCEFISPEEQGPGGGDEQLIYCSAHADEVNDGALQLVRSATLFDKSELVFEEIKDFQTMSEFVIAAGTGNNRELYINASVSGSDFAPAHFPPGFSTLHSEYTVLQSETHAIFLHATISDKEGAEYGRILKSNSNGTFYVSSLDGVNRDKDGYVDFEKVHGIEGLSLANIIANVDDGDLKEKNLQTRITHNDGADWSPLPLPEDRKDSEGRNYECHRNPDKCHVHLYGYTEKSIFYPYASSSAAGLILGNGNVGEFLDRSGRRDALFMSVDAGISWKEVRQGLHIWAYGDQGSLIVALSATDKTDTLYYTEDEGRKWSEFKFADSPIEIYRLSTVPSDSAKSFIIWAKTSDGIATYNVDFGGTRKGDCKLDEANPEFGDYRQWSPGHPFQEDEACLFGHVSVYHRKKIGQKCWNGPLLDSHGLHEISRNCSCALADFECDYNYERTTSGECMLVAGLEPPDHSEQCKKDSSLVHYYTPTGYRKIPLDTCQGGHELQYDRWYEKPCPGHEEDYDKMHRGLSGFWFFIVAIVIPFSVAGGVGYYVYRKWDGKLGAIRLGETSADNVLDIDKPWIKYPIMAVSALVALTLAVPGILSSAWRSGMALIGRHGGRYTTKASFARSRGEYAVIDDEDELLGEEDDEEA